MSPSEFALCLSGATYDDPVSKHWHERAKAEGLVVVFGASDDLMEFRGAIYDEIGAYNGTTALLTSNGLLQNDCSDDYCPHFEMLKAIAVPIRALWSPGGGYSWKYETKIPHATFEITEDGDPYCQGIVFKLSDVTTTEREP